MNCPLEYLKAGNCKNRRVPSTSLPGIYNTHQNKAVVLSPKFQFVVPSTASVNLLEHKGDKALPCARAFRNSLLAFREEEGDHSPLPLSPLLPRSDLALSLPVTSPTQTHPSDLSLDRSSSLRKPSRSPCSESEDPPPRSQGPRAHHPLLPGTCCTRTHPSSPSWSSRIHGELRGDRALVPNQCLLSHLADDVEPGVVL